MFINNIMKFRFFGILLALLLLLSLIVCFYEILNIDNSVYNINNDEIEIIRKKHLLKYKRHEIDKIKIIKQNRYMTIIQFKKGKNKYNIYFKENPYLIKLYNISLVKLFNVNS